MLQKQCQKELAALEKEIEERLAEVAAVKADLEGRRSEETDLERRLGDGKRRLQARPPCWLVHLERARVSAAALT